MENKIQVPDHTKPYNWSLINMPARYHYNANRFINGVMEKHNKSNEEAFEIYEAFNKKFNTSTPEPVWGFMTDAEVDELIENPKPIYKDYNLHEFFITKMKPIEIQWKEEPRFPEFYKFHAKNFLARFEAYGCLQKAYWYFLVDNNISMMNDDNFFRGIRDEVFVDRGYPCCNSCYLESALHKKRSQQVDIQALGYARCYQKEHGDKERNTFVSKAKKRGYKYENWEFHRIGDGLWEAVRISGFRYPNIIGGTE